MGKRARGLGFKGEVGCFASRTPCPLRKKSRFFLVSFLPLYKKKSLGFFFSFFNDSIAKVSFIKKKSLNFFSLFKIPLNACSEISF